MSHPQRYVRPELDVLRFLAFLFVFLYHRMDYVPVDAKRNPVWFSLYIVGAFGVPVFFLLSAFLITELLLRERQQTGSIHVKAFYIRRILRIWPLYFAAFFGFTALNRFLPGVAPTTHASWAAFSLFAGNWYVTFKGWIAGPVDPLWSISVEEQFYLCIPVLALYGGRRALAAVSGILIVLSYCVIFWYAAHHTMADQGEWTNSFVHFQFFAAGSLLALFLRGRVPRLPTYARILAFLAAVIAWLTAFVYFGVQSWDPQAAPRAALAGWFFVLLGSILLFFCLFGLSERAVPPVLSYLGRISFGLYVFHSLILWLVFEHWGRWLTAIASALHLGAVHDVFGTILVLLLTVAVSHLSYQYFERPFLGLKSRFTFVPSRD